MGGISAKDNIISSRFSDAEMQEADSNTDDDSSNDYGDEDHSIEKDKASGKTTTSQASKAASSPAELAGVGDFFKKIGSKGKNSKEMFRVAGKHL